MYVVLNKAQLNYKPKNRSPSRYVPLSLILFNIVWFYTIIFRPFTHFVNIGRFVSRRYSGKYCQHKWMYLFKWLIDWFVCLFVVNLYHMFLIDVINSAKSTPIRSLSLSHTHSPFGYVSNCQFIWRPFQLANKNFDHQLQST